ncbi:hypothetical protein [Micromonospora aurantiaca (nom. illeg.)]|uniref:hypothetical protein n=1 Tax=Micromonospora aurantiaca (nom. illeg.) TaxID=47850 RepID=UPI00340D5F51
MALILSAARAKRASAVGASLYRRNSAFAGTTQGHGHQQLASLLDSVLADLVITDDIDEPDRLGDRPRVRHRRLTGPDALAQEPAECDRLREGAQRLDSLSVPPRVRPFGQPHQVPGGARDLPKNTDCCLAEMPAQQAQQSHRCGVTRPGHAAQQRKSDGDLAAFTAAVCQFPSDPTPPRRVDRRHRLSQRPDEPRLHTHRRQRVGQEPAGSARGRLSLVDRRHDVDQLPLACGVRFVRTGQTGNMFRVGIRPPAVRQRSVRMSELQDHRVFKKRAGVERLALASVAHRIGEDSILIIMATTMPARHVIDKAIPTRRPGAARCSDRKSAASRPWRIPGSATSGRWWTSPWRPTRWCTNTITGISPPSMSAGPSRVGNVTTSAERATSYRR